MPNYRKYVLLIGYHFPPHDGVGSTRIYKAAKYLRNRYHVHVVTSNRAAKEECELDGVNVYPVSELFEASPKQFDKLSWVPKLERAINKLDKIYGYDIIWQTANPYLPLITLPIVKRKVNKPYIVDLRDSWTLMPYRQERTGFGKLHDIVSKFSESKVLREAAAVTTATEGITEAYKSKYPQIEDKFVTVPNGFDKTDYIGSPNIKQESDTLRLFYAGKFSWYRDIEPTIAALSELRESTEIKLIHAGHPEERLERMAKKYGINSSVKNIGYLNDEELQTQIHRADLCLAISGGSKQEMTTKIFDYIGCRRPILACGPQNGSMCNVVDQFQYGYTTNNTKTDIAESVNDYLDDGPVDLGEGPYAEWTREKTAEKLSAVIESTTA